MVKSKDELVDAHVSVRQCSLAVNALLSHSRKIEAKAAETQMFAGKEQNVWLQVAVKQMHPEKKLKPAKIPLVHALVDPRESAVCLITKDPQREYKDLLETHKIRFISRVVGIEKLKGKFKPFEARRLLLKENGLFLADERVVPLLPKLLGSKFFAAKKQPIPVCLTRKDLKGELERAINATYFHQNQGTCTSVKVGTLSQTPAQVVENLKTALPEIVKHVQGGWDNVQSLSIKTNKSASLPIWNCELGSAEGARWDGLVAVSESESESESEAEAESDSDEDGPEEAEESEMEVDVAPLAPEVKGKGKKRVAETEAETPKKKVKADAIAAFDGGVDVPTKKVKKGKRAASEEPNVISLVPTKKSTAHAVVTQAVEILPSAAIPDAPAQPSTSSKEKKKKRDGLRVVTDTPAVPAQSTAAAAADAIFESWNASVGPSNKKDKKRKHDKQIIADTPPPVHSTNTVPASQPIEAPVASVPPVTPSDKKKKKKARALAADFFDDGAHTDTPLVPPNTPADGIAQQTPVSTLKKRTHAKVGVEDTPVSSAISKLTEKSAVETPAPKAKAKTKAKAKVSEKVVSEPAAPAPAEVIATVAAVDEPVKSKKKSKAPTAEKVSAPAAGAALEDAAEPVDVKPKKKKAKVSAEVTNGDAALEPAVVSVGAGLTKEELKTKRNAARAEKKKEKVVGANPAGKSAKDAIIGKKRM